MTRSRKPRARPRPACSASRGGPTRRWWMCAEHRRPVLGWLLAALSTPRATAQPAPASHDASRTFEFTTSTTIQAGLAGHDGLDVWIPMPVSDGYQEVTLLSCALDDTGGQPAS